MRTYRKLNLRNISDYGNLKYLWKTPSAVFIWMEKIMKNNKVLYLVASVIFSLLTLGYIAVIAVDFYYGYTPQYLVVLHIVAVITLSVAAIVNFKRYIKGNRQ